MTKSKRLSKREIYAAHGIVYADGKILSPLGMIEPLLKNGNEKLGLGVWTFSTLPGTGEYTAVVNGERVAVCGTCKCDCPGCYAKTGHYHRSNVLTSNAINTIIARDYLDFMVRAISAQIAADNIKLCRIHAAGDFSTPEYINSWREIVKATPETSFWTYTKNPAAENAFDDLNNINIVKSIIPGIGFNFGHCGYILDTFNALTAAGAKVHICKCGFDKNQHCVNCRGCVDNDFVLFVEHSTGYKAEKDPLYNDLMKIAMGV